MNIAIQGSRSSNESWMTAQQLPFDQVPHLTPEEMAEASNTGILPEDLARIQYAIRLTDEELKQKVMKISRLIERWMADNNISGQIQQGILNTLQGKLRFEFDHQSGPSVVEIDEKLVDDILSRGSREAAEALARLLAFNLGDAKLAVAS